MNSEEQEFTIHFSERNYAPVRLKAGAILSEHLTIENSPLLFGCRTGICGTCLSVVEAVGCGEIAAASEDERDLLDIIAPDNPKARLACQIALSADITIHYLGK